MQQPQLQPDYTLKKDVSECPNTHGLAEKRSLTDGVLKIICLY